jgi:hypothetical protein
MTLEPWLIQFIARNMQRIFSSDDDMLATNLDNVSSIRHAFSLPSHLPYLPQRGEGLIGHFSETRPYEGMSSSLQELPCLEMHAFHSSF